jgi:hypothetical protein
MKYVCTLCCPCPHEVGLVGFEVDMSVWCVLELHAQRPQLYVGCGQRWRRHRLNEGTGDVSDDWRWVWSTWDDQILLRNNISLALTFIDGCRKVQRVEKSYARLWLFPIKAFESHWFFGGGRGHYSLRAQSSRVKMIFSKYNETNFNYQNTPYVISINFFFFYFSCAGSWGVNKLFELKKIFVGGENDTGTVTLDSETED